jgi:GNAT superfamily N-acetyltransferase
MCRIVEALCPPHHVRRDRADAHFVCLGKDDEVLARASVWTCGTPALEGQPTGAIGHYAADNATAAEALLQHCCRNLVARGCAIAIGPMDGNTWRRYRFVTSRGDEPPFLFEPENPDEYPSHFTTAGFRALAHYVSTLNPDLSRPDPDLESVEAEIARRGVDIRPLDVDQFEHDVEAVYHISQAAFAKSFLFTPLARDAFLELYQPVRDVIQPDLVLLAEHAGRPVGFIFGVGDWNQRARGEAVDTLIVKSLAILPGQQYAGLGTVLLGRCHAAALRLGYRRAIHALMHEENHRVARLSSRYAIPFRRYTLFAKPLSQPGG